MPKVKVGAVIDPAAVDFVRDAATWPSIADLADAYGVSARWVRGLVERRRVECIRLDVLRINPASFEQYLRMNYVNPDQ